MIELEWRLFETGHCIHPEVSSRAGGSWRPCEYPAFVTLLRHPSEGWLLFDTGYGQAFADATRRLPESLYRMLTPVHWNPEQSVVAQLARSGIKSTEISQVLLSHFHGDHVGGLADFPDARIWCAREAWEDLHGRTRFSALTAGLLPALAPRRDERRLSFFEHAPRANLPEAFLPFGPGHDLFGDGSLYAIPLPGHAAGHYGLGFRARDAWIFLVADAAWSSRAIRDDAPPPRWTTALLGDSTSYRATLSGLHSISTRAGGALLVPSHCRDLRR